MKRTGIVILLIGLFLGVFNRCSSESEIPPANKILSETLTTGSWQVSFHHSLTKNELDHSEFQLTFYDNKKVDAHTQKSSENKVMTHQGSYDLLYFDDDAPDSDDVLEYYYDNEKEKDLFLSLAFSMNEVLILNSRWKVKSFSSSTVILQAGDIILTFTKS